MPRKVTDSYAGPASILTAAGVVEITCQYSVSVDYPAGFRRPYRARVVEGPVFGKGLDRTGRGLDSLPDGREGQILVSRVTIGVTAGTFEGALVGKSAPP
jgi:hypothetical protein